MSAHLYNKFRARLALRLIKASWLNKVANLWNYARGGQLINLSIPEEPTPENGPKWDLDLDKLEEVLAQHGFVKLDSLNGDILASKIKVKTGVGDNGKPIYKTLQKLYDDNELYTPEGSVRTLTLCTGIGTYSGEFGEVLAFTMQSAKVIVVGELGEAITYSDYNHPSSDA